MNKSERYYTNYPNEPIGGGNPYYRCVSCKRSDPEINMRLEGHRETCAYRRKVEMLEALGARDNRELYVLSAPAYNYDDAFEALILADYGVKVLDKSELPHDCTFLGEKDKLLAMYREHWGAEDEPDVMMVAAYVARTW